MGYLRLSIKWLICKLGFGGMLIEYCQDCGIEQPVLWHAENELYSAVSGVSPHDASGNISGCLCPRCFDCRAEAKGIFLRWVPEVRYAPNEHTQA